MLRKDCDGSWGDRVIGKPAAREMTGGGVPINGGWNIFFALGYISRLSWLATVYWTPDEHGSHRRMGLRARNVVDSQMGREY